MPKDGKGLLPVDAMAAELAAQKSGRGWGTVWTEPPWSSGSRAASLWMTIEGAALD